MFPETGSVSVKLTGAAYRQSSTMDYWEGVTLDGAPSSGDASAE